MKVNLLVVIGIILLILSVDSALAQQIPPNQNVTIRFQEKLDYTSMLECNDPTTCLFTNLNQSSFATSGRTFYFGRNISTTNVTFWTQDLYSLGGNRLNFNLTPTRTSEAQVIMPINIRLSDYDNITFRVVGSTSFLNPTFLIFSNTNGESVRVEVYDESEIQNSSTECTGQNLNPKTGSTNTGNQLRNYSFTFSTLKEICPGFATNFNDFNLTNITFGVSENQPISFPNVYTLGQFTNFTILSCETTWNCTAWSDPVNSCGTRTCTDLNGCNDETDKPSESVTCPGGGGGGGSPPTGEIIGPPEFEEPLEIITDEPYFEPPDEEFEDDGSLGLNVTWEFDKYLFYIIRPPGSSYLDDIRVRNKLNRTIRLQFAYNEELSTEGTLGWVGFRFNTPQGEKLFTEIEGVNLPAWTLFAPYKYIPFEVRIPENAEKKKYAIVYEVRDHYGYGRNLTFIVNTGDEIFTNRLLFWLNSYVINFNFYFCKDVSLLFSGDCPTNQLRRIVIRFRVWHTLLFLFTMLLLSPTIRKRIRKFRKQMMLINRKK